jgi:hypothetical protein
MLGGMGMAASALAAWPNHPQTYAILPSINNSGAGSNDPLLRFLREEAVLSIFWILRVVAPMSDDGGNGHSRVPILSFPPIRTRAYKESPDMKRAMFSVMTLIVLAGLTGCSSQPGRRAMMASDEACNSGQCANATADGCQSGGAACESPCENGRVPLRDRLGGLCHKGRTNNEGGEEASEAPAAGPATGAVTYPYYTIRGPRDFYAKNPRSIGP